MAGEIDCLSMLWSGSPSARSHGPLQPIRYANEKSWSNSHVQDLQDSLRIKLIAIVPNKQTLNLGCAVLDLIIMGAQMQPDSIPFPLTDTDRQYLAAGDAKYKPHTWDDVRKIIGIRSICLSR